MLSLRIYVYMYTWEYFHDIWQICAQKRMKIVPMISSIAGYYTSTYARAGEGRENGITPPPRLNAWQRTRVPPNR